MIHGIGTMTQAEIMDELKRGGRFVVYRYCFSLVVVTYRRGTDVYFIKAGESAALRGLKWTLLTLVAGWWGFPWGPIFSVQCLYTNLTGGKEVTADVIRLSTN